MDPVTIRMPKQRLVVNGRVWTWQEELKDGKFSRAFGTLRPLKKLKC